MLSTFEIIIFTKKIVLLDLEYFSAVIITIYEKLCINVSSISTQQKQFITFIKKK